MIAAASRHAPMPIWMRRLGQLDTMPAPRNAPATAAPIMRISVRASTGTSFVKMNACVIAPIVCPTFSVPGTSSSRTIFHWRKIAVVVAKDPIPRVSKKLVTNPVPTVAAFGACAAPAIGSARSTRMATYRR